MKNIKIVDMTLRKSVQSPSAAMSFKEKIDIARELDRIGVDIIETIPISDQKSDALLIKTIASIVTKSAVSCQVGFDSASVDAAWAAVSSAKNPRLLVSVPVSAVQMEYVCRRKGPKILELITELVTRCAAHCSSVEFSAEDATRAESDFLRKAISCAIKAGATDITVCDSAGIMLPDEFTRFVAELKNDIAEIVNISLSTECSDSIGMASASAFSSINAGVCQIKTSGKRRRWIQSMARQSR